MLIIYILIFVTTLFLIFYGNLNIWIGIPLFLLSAGAISLYLAKILNLNIRLARLRKKLKVKWIGELAYVAGLNLLPHQDIYLALTRRDSLLFLSKQNEISIKLKDIDNILICKGDKLSDLSHGNINEYLNSSSDITVFNNTCNLLKSNRYLSKKDFVIFSLYPKQNNQHKNWNQGLIILILKQGKGNFKQFVKRPEIRSKVRYYDKQLNKENLQKR